MNVEIRPATQTDLEAINAIYNHYVVHSTCTYQETPSTAAERAEWFAAHDAKHPITVAVDEAGTVLGWGALNSFHSRCAYRFTVENSVYVRHDLHRQGIGRAILADLLERARSLGHRTVIAGISADQAASIALHRQFGFEQVGRLEKVGFKFERWLDVIYMQWMPG